MREKDKLKKDNKDTLKAVETSNKKIKKKSFVKNTVEFLSWIKKQFSHIKIETFVPISIQKWWNSHRKQINLATLALAFVSFFITVITLTLNLDAIFATNQGSVKYSEDNSIKYIDIKNGYITEKLKVEAGDLLPSVTSYFSSNYDIDKDYKISYYLNNEAIPIETFASKSEDGLLYIVGSNNTLTVRITNYGEEYESSLEITDRTAPTIQLEALTITEGETINPVAFVVIFLDNSGSFDFTATLVNEGDYSKPGTYDVEVKVCDISNNCTTGKTTLTVEKKKTTSSNQGSSGNKKPSSGTTSSAGGNSSDDGSSSGSSGNSKPSNGSSGNSNPSGGSSGNGDSSGGNSSSGSSGNGGSSLATASVRVETGTYTKENYNLTINYYGTKHTTHYDKVTFTTYNDGFAKVSSYEGKGSQNWDYSGFSNDATQLGLMKRDAMALFLSNKDFYESAQSIFLSGSNTERTKVGASKLSIDYDLNIIAQIRCYEIVYGNALGHTRPGNKTVKNLIVNEYGYSASKASDGKRHYGENIAYGQSYHDDAIADLIASPGHYANIIDSSFKKIGVGALYDNANRRWIRVQIFTS